MDALGYVASEHVSCFSDDSEEWGRGKGVKKTDANSCKKVIARHKDMRRKVMGSNPVLP